MATIKNSEKLIAIGKIVGARGLTGALKVTSYSGEYGHFRDLTEVVLLRPGDEEKTAEQAKSPGGAGLPLAGGRTRFATPADYARYAAAKTVDRGPLRLELRIADAEISGLGLALRFVGYENPEDAAVLSGMEIMVPASKGAPLGRGEWYVRDLVGLDLVVEGRVTGTVVSVFEGAADPCLEVQLLTGDTSLVPFRKEFIGTIDLGSRRVELLAPWILEP